MTIEDQKRALRRGLRRTLAELAPAARIESGPKLLHELSALPAWQLARTVLLFAPMATEPDLNALWSSGGLSGKTCVYPAVQGKELSLHRVQSLDDLHPVAPWDLFEPAAEPATRVSVDEIDLLLVPGLAFDGRGGRVGRGGGFYDRLLASRRAGRPMAIGIGFHFQCLDVLPLAPHDAFLDATILY